MHVHAFVSVKLFWTHVTAEIFPNNGIYDVYCLHRFIVLNRITCRIRQNLILIDNCRSSYWMNLCLQSNILWQVSHCSFFLTFVMKCFVLFFKKGVVPKTLLQSRRGNVFSLLLCELLADGLLSRSTSTFCWWSTSSPESKNLWARIMWRPNDCLPKNALSHNEHLTAVDLLLLEHDVALRLFDGTLLILVEFGCLCCFVMCSQCTIRLEGFRASYECTRRVGIRTFRCRHCILWIVLA